MNSVEIATPNRKTGDQSATGELTPGEGNLRGCDPLRSLVRQNHVHSGDFFVEVQTGRPVLTEFGTNDQVVEQLNVHAAGHTAVRHAVRFPPLEAATERQDVVVLVKTTIAHPSLSPVTRPASVTVSMVGLLLTQVPPVEGPT